MYVFLRDLYSTALSADSQYSIGALRVLSLPVFSIKRADTELVSALKCSIFNRFQICIFDTDIGTEELGHLEMVGALVHQLTRNIKEEDIAGTPFAAYFVDHTTGVYPQFASGYPWSASTMQSTGDVIADLTEDLAAEQKARLTYDNILRLSDDPDVNNVIRFLREREIVHFQRFGEAIALAKEKMDKKNIYFTNPAFDK